jgi:hypothetical protein
METDVRKRKPFRTSVLYVQQTYHKRGFKKFRKTTLYCAIINMGNAVQDMREYVTDKCLLGMTRNGDFSKSK